MKAEHHPSPQGQNIGGAYIETFGMNSKAQRKETDNVMVAETDRRFELFDPVGTSGAATVEDHF